VLFNSLIFPFFYLGVYGLYLAFSRSRRAQNGLLLAASYVFYGYWDWRFLSLLALSTLVDFSIGRALAREEDGRRRKRLLLVSLCTNLGALGFFKYFNFFADGFARVMDLVGLPFSPFTLDVVLPVGISFYTFQTLSYTIDVYRRRLEPTRDLLDFALFVSFFPQLVAGPIERARNLLPQMAKPRRLLPEQVQAGIWLILFGYFQKVVVADNCATIADAVFGGYAGYEGFDLFLGVVAFTLQIYADFSGYSNIARGLAKLMGFELMVNFRLPYTALNPSDFWARWHISLSTWLRDYLYIPLGGNRSGARRTAFNLMATMVLGGLWHGAAWNFVLWGAFHGLVLIAYRVLDRNPEHGDPWSGRYSRLRIFSKMALMLALVMAGWIFFRCRTLDQIGHFFGAMGLAFSGETLRFGFNLVVYAAPMFVLEFWQYRRSDLLVATKLRTPARAALYGALFVWILVFGQRESPEFIYFQF